MVSTSHLPKAKGYEFWDYKNSKKKANTRMRKRMYRMLKRSYKQQLKKELNG